MQAGRPQCRRQAGENAVRAGQLSTRQYAKRQATWFRHQLPSNWPRIDAKNIIHEGKIETLYAKLLLT